MQVVTSEVVGDLYDGLFEYNPCFFTDLMQVSAIDI